ncbi:MULTISPECIES: hypothetical protein [unclassified Streptomyces]|uniref:hypothetical protein n=1 Tax=unclassified Streptomyces TaxID=2593676 RepID=UPI00081DA8B1|nr:MULTISPECIES: hypothetical protein [unclassified Streptomyces]MYZ35029.1 hypothetical protein [Streptomyces sp. SID4917]SCF72230.1 hypothetical protein GA0115259_101543 [Streptomyces sp. MnatMP-M17]
MHIDLETTVAALSAGDHVHAHGTDSRGVDTARAGYLLAAPRPETGQRNSGQAEGWLVYVGKRGDAPALSNRLMLYPDTGRIAHTSEQDLSLWRATTLRETGASSRTKNLRIRFGGQATRSAVEPTQDTTVCVTYNTEGWYSLDATDDGCTQVFECRLGTKIWWAPLPDAPVDLFADVL